MSNHAWEHGFVSMSDMLHCGSAFADAFSSGTVTGKNIHKCVGGDIRQTGSRKAGNPWMKM